VAGILLHKVSDAFRASSRERELRVTPNEPDADDDADFDAQGLWRAPPAPWCDPEVALRSRRFHAAFTAALSALPPKQARAFALREIDGLDPPDICRELGVTESNLWVLLFRARTGLRRMLDPDALAPA
jgi:RNA polymerase sigma-70 factor (ECF subfamily)